MRQHDGIPILRPTTSILDIFKKVEEELLKRGGHYEDDKTVQHRFADGVYSREYFMPRGFVGTSKMHGRKNFFVLLSGHITIWSREGKKEYHAPEILITIPGTRRIIKAHEDSTIATFHGTHETDIEKIEEEVMIPHEREEEYLKKLELEDTHEYLSHVALLEKSRRLLGRNR